MVLQYKYKNETIRDVRDVMRKISLYIIGITMITLQLFINTYAFAYDPTINNGLSYLTSTQNADGSWGSETTDTELLPSTVSVIETLQVLNQTGTANYSDALLWLQLQGFKTTDYLSERIHALSVSGTDQDLLISYLDDMTGAWGGDDSPDVDNLDTALALSALKKINYSDRTTMDYAVNYLLSTQNADGGWGLKAGMDSEVYYTALISSTLQQFPRTTSIATAINKATIYLINHQQTDGSWGTVYETALAYIALVGETTDGTVLGNAINYLTSTQLPNGSWDDDPYSTALALKALADVKPNLSISSNDITFSNPTPTAGETITITANIKNSGPAQGSDSGKHSSYDIIFMKGGKMGALVELTLEQIAETLKKLSPEDIDELELLLQEEEINKRRAELKSGDYLKAEELESLKNV